MGFLLGLGQSERVLEVVRNPRENGELKYRAQSRLLLLYIIINTNKNIDCTRQFVTVIEGICADV